VTFEVVADAEAAYAYVTTHYPLGRTQHMKGIVQRRNGETIAAVVYDDCNGANIFMHVASDGSRHWLTRHFLHEAFKYPFITQGCSRITLWIDGRNTDSRRFAVNLGFRPEAVLEKAGRDGHDVMIYRMFRQECRYA
jgi:RimJ/RimL family protein N-acetyltransferase